ncbi:MAG TPA: DUF3618 domain-containing protein [Longimicrobiales bacterium]|nr:DUF3618 domain-containing protein [Longimicrobiales bacterium]
MREETEAEVLARIEATRSRIGETIEEIGERVNPDRLQRELKARAREQVQDAKDTMKHKARKAMRGIEHEVNDAGRGLWDTIRENPLPAGLVGVGLAWLVANGAGNRGRGHPEGASSERAELPAYPETAAAAGVTDDGNAGAEEGLKDRAAEAADQVRDKASEAVDRMGHRARRAERRVEDAVQENPLAAGAIAAALGFAAGMMIPETERENEMMGPARDRLVEKGQRKIRNAGEKARDVVRDTANESARRALDEAWPSRARREREQVSEPWR